MKIYSKSLDSDLLKSLGIHVLGFMILGMSLRFSDVIHATPQPVQVMQAVMIDQGHINKEVARLAAAEKAIQQKEQAKQAAAQQKVVEAEQKRQKEAQKLKAMQEKIFQDQKQAEIALKQAQQKAQKEADAAKAQKIATEKHQKEVEAAKIQKLAAEKHQKEVEAAKIQKQAVEKQHKANEPKKKTTADQKLARQKALQKEAEQALQDQLLADQGTPQAMEEIDRYHQLIIARIQQHWRRDLDQSTGLSCLVKVRLLATGEVIDAAIVKSSGSAAFDRAATMAVMRASPLPLPEDAYARNEFVRGFNFLFKPEDA